MEECTQSLGDLIENYCEMQLGPFTHELIYEVILGVSKALDYLHNECKILHGDLKSHNILIKGRLKYLFMYLGNNVRNYSQINNEGIIMHISSKSFDLKHFQILKLYFCQNTIFYSYHKLFHAVFFKFYC